MIGPSVHLYRDAGCLDHARDIFQGVRSLAPSSEIPEVGLGTVAFQRGRFEEARKQISLIYIQGTKAHIREHKKALYDEILITEMKLDDLWQTMREGEDTLEQFKETLTTWKDLHFKAIGFYKERNRKDKGQKRLF